MICGEPIARGGSCRNWAAKRASDRKCFMHSRDESIESERQEARRRGGRVSADFTRLGSPKAVQRYLGRIAHALEGNPSPDTVALASTRRAIAELALRALAEDGKDRRIAELERLVQDLRSRKGRP